MQRTTKRDSLLVINLKQITNLNVCYTSIVVPMFTKIHEKKSIWLDSMIKDYQICNYRTNKKIDCEALQM